MAHANARLTQREGCCCASASPLAAPPPTSPAKWASPAPAPTAGGPRYQQHGPAGLHDRPSTAHTHPRRLPTSVEAEIARLRRVRKLGPARIEALVGRPASTVHRVLCRLGLNRLAVMDRPTGRVIRRYERAHPGQLLHLDVKKLGRLRPGGGHRVHGRASAQHRVRTARPGSGPTSPTRNAPPPWTHRCTCTTVTVSTPRSAATHPSPASTTPRDTTASAAIT